jgi:hypothetical protein
MSPILVSFLVFACVYGGALLGFALQVPEHHRDAESREVLKVATGLVGTMAALVLGLLVASAKSSYDSQKDEFTKLCADVALLDRSLAHYGPEAASTREVLRQVFRRGTEELFQSSTAAPSTTGEALYDHIMALVPATDQQRAIQAGAAQMSISLGRSRWLMYTQSGSTISSPLLVIVVFWLMILFVSFGLYARPNATVRVALLISALSVAAAIFLIIEMDRPFDGLIRISEAPMREVAAHLGR